MAAGVLLIEEAGGMISDFKGGHSFLQNGDIIAGSPKIFTEIISSIGTQLQ